MKKYLGALTGAVGLSFVFSVGLAAAADNLSLNAGSDGSSKASGSSYGNVRDGNLSSYWAPSGSTGSVSIKWGSATSVSSVIIREAAGYEGNITSWKLVNHDNGDEVMSGSGAGVVNFSSINVKN
jgi:hypothetical protein